MLFQKGLVIAEIIHDDNKVVDSTIDKYEINNQKYLWHKCKGLISKFKEKFLLYRATTCSQWDQIGSYQQSCEYLSLPAEYFQVEHTRGLKYLALAAQDIAYKLKLWFYTCARHAKERKIFST
ncbi:hypothetical protein R1sor_025326 [Riccia sorocarpa]|uniref:Uncharacterized protein n=1 Tax=Riccia sorocarpa TaxID=122646 RepID=A0ABD3G8B2_9MARC